MSRVTFALEPQSLKTEIICPDCGSNEIEQQEANGSSVCTQCGVIVEENNIVSNVDFVEGQHGTTNMVGRFVSSTSSRAHTGGPRGGRYGFSRDSRETTLANGRRRIQEVASRLRLGTHYVDAAHRLFQIAVEKNFVQGRRTSHVVAACLYIACRQEKSQHMLIDFSDALQVNVYTLGTCFLKFRRLLGLKLEIIDPALYVYRFAAHLDLDEKANAVALTALRLVSRMKRDWIVSGRRPAGICAAALLIASRAHGFRKHQQDVTRILRVCGLTVNLRVKEFEQTPSAALTLDQFNNVDVAEEADPPVYTRNKIKEARIKAIQDGNAKLLHSGQLDDPVSGRRAKDWREEKRKNGKRDQFDALYSSLERELADGGDDTKDLTGTGKEGASHVQLVLREDDPVSQVQDEKLRKLYPRTKHGKAMILANHATEEEMKTSTLPVEAKISLNDWANEMPDDMETEFDDIFRSEEEERQKEAIFNKINKDYLELQERKESERVTADAATRAAEKDDAAQAEGFARYKSTRGRKRRRDQATDETVEERVKASLLRRKHSPKINYDAIGAIFGDDGQFDTGLVDDSNVTGGDDDDYGMI